MTNNKISRAWQHNILIIIHQVQSSSVTGRLTMDTQDKIKQKKLEREERRRNQQQNNIDTNDYGNGYSYWRFA